jgi:hypothetical protein
MMRAGIRRKNGNQAIILNGKGGDKGPVSLNTCRMTRFWMMS